MQVLRVCLLIMPLYRYVLIILHVLFQPQARNAENLVYADIDVKRPSTSRRQQEIQRLANDKEGKTIYAEVRARDGGAIVIR